MALPYCIVLMLCLIFGTTITLYKKEIEIHFERIEAMNQKENKSSGQFTTQDKFGTAVTLEWQKTNMVSPRFAKLMHNVSDLGIAAFTRVEMQFLKAFPQVVSSEPYFKTFEPLFKEGVGLVDWQAVEKKMQTLLKNHFIIDTTKFSSEILKMFANDVCIFVTVKNNAGIVLGFANFLVKPDFPQGTVKVTSIAVEQKMQNRGLAKLLMSSVFAIKPDIQRIFLCTRVTNTVALRAYSSWGFVMDENPIQNPHYTFNLKHWTFMEYRAEKAVVLQKVAIGLVKRS